MNKKPDIRFLYDMKKVIYDRKWLKSAKNFPVYYMYRGVKRKNKLRYDITEIVPKMLGKEFPKTKGHEHSGNFQEIYTVLKGEAIYLIQKCKNHKVSDVFAVKAKKGESVLIPASYGHITINPINQELREANWISKNCKNNYHLFEKKQGACYYYTKSGSRAIAKGEEEDLSSSTWIKNKNYGRIPKLRFKKPLKRLSKEKIKESLAG